MTPLFIHVYITTSDSLVYYLNIYLNDGYGQLPSLIHKIYQTLSRRLNILYIKFKIRTLSSLQQRCSPRYVSVGILLTVENTCLYQARKKRSYTCAKCMDFASVSNGPHRWRNGWRACLEFVRSWVRTPVGSNQRQYHWYLLLLR